MQTYSSIGQSISREEKEDIISCEEFPSDENTHPRSVMFVRRTNDRPYPFFTSSIMSIINKGNSCDPVTRERFSNLVIERAKMYNQSLIYFPNYKLKNLNTKDLYLRWINTYKSEKAFTDDEILKIRLEANCFLQAEDLMGIFQTFNGKGSLKNRSNSVEFLSKTKRKWILRHSSLKDTEYNKAYVLTYTNLDDTFSHIVIVHKIGEGFFYNVKINRQSSVESFLDYDKSYPTIINTLEKEIPHLLKYTADYI